jgi:hypothetical protein
MSKAKPNSTTTAKEGIADENITEFPFWTNEPGQPPQFWGTHWQCDLCDAISSLGPAEIRHADDCPNAGTAITG